MSKLVKQDINFMEYPLWVQDEEFANKSEDGFIWKDRDGYNYRAGYKPPAKIDFITLMFLLLKSQQEGWNNKIKLSKYEILKGCYNSNPGKPQYNRLKDSLKRWSMVKLEFNGTFYNGKRYETLVFGIVDEYSIEINSQHIEITFASKWLQKIQESNYFKYINFDQIKILRSPLAMRLYEILVKSFQNRDQWEIDAMKLAQKIPMNEKYPSDIIPKIKAAVNRINEYTTFKIKLIIKRPRRGVAKFIFVKITEEEAKQLLPAVDLSEDDNFKSLIDILPEEHQDKKTILEAIASAYKKHGFDYTARNIRYTNRNCKGNYRAYLNKALKADWGLALKEDKEAKQKTIDRQIDQRRQEQEALECQKQMRCQAQDYMQTLSSEELQTMREEADSRLDGQIKKSAKTIGNYDTIIDMIMVDIVQERLTAAR